MRRTSPQPTSFDVSAFIDQLSQKLQHEFRSARLATHHGTHGQKVEGALRSFLRAHLPQRFGVGTGHVLDFYNRVSQQTDIVLYDALHCPRLGGGGVDEPDYYPVDGVLGVIQVTDQVLGRKKLLEDMERIESVRRLSLIWQMPEHFRDHRPFGIIFAARAQKDLGKLRDAVDERRAALLLKGAPHECVNAVVMLDRGIICYRHPCNQRFIGVDPAVYERGEGTRAHWDTHLAEFGSRTLAWFLILLLDRLAIQAEAVILGHADSVRRGRGQSLDLSYAAAVDAQVPVPSLFSYLNHAWLEQRRRQAGRN